MSVQEGRPLPKFGEWDVNDPSSADGFTIIFNKASDDKKSGGKNTPAPKNDPKSKQLGKTQSKKWWCCINSQPEQ